MGSEYFINSQELENKVRDLLPSQGGAGAGFDLSASTQIIPVIDLTESAEGSNLRQDLQTCVDYATTRTDIRNVTESPIVTTTGFFKVNIFLNAKSGSCNIGIDDGTTVKVVRLYEFNADQSYTIDNFNVFLRAGDTLVGTSSSGTADMYVFTRQIADITGNLTNPLGFV